MVPYNLKITRKSQRAFRRIMARTTVAALAVSPIALMAPLGSVAYGETVLERAIIDADTQIAGVRTNLIPVAGGGKNSQINYHPGNDADGDDPKAGDGARANSDAAPDAGIDKGAEPKDETGRAGDAAPRADDGKDAATDASPKADSGKGAALEAEPVPEGEKGMPGEPAPGANGGKGAAEEPGTKGGGDRDIEPGDAAPKAGSEEKMPAENDAPKAEDGKTPAGDDAPKPAHEDKADENDGMSDDAPEDGPSSGDGGSDDPADSDQPGDDSAAGETDDDAASE